MGRYLSKSIFLLITTLIVICGIYPLALWVVGKCLFPFQAEGSLLTSANGTLIGSKLIAQPFTKDEYFQPRLSAASYDAPASASSALAASNYLLRDRIARTIGPIAKYKNGPKAGQLMGLELENWFAQDKFQGNAQIVSQWATLHNSLAQSWVSADLSHSAYVDNWAKQNPEKIAQFIKENPNNSSPKATDLALSFFQNISKENPGKFPVTKTATNAKGEAQTLLVLDNKGPEIQAIFFDMWRQENPEVALELIPGDYVMTSASGLDPHITLQNALFQLDRVAGKWASNLKQDSSVVKKEIVKILEQNATAPFGGLAGEEFVNVLEINLELNKKYGSPS